MTPADVIEIARESIIIMLLIGAPILLIALFTGLAISLVQALTQIQEMTLSFVPKIIVIFASLLLFLPFMLAKLSGFTERLSDRIVGLG